MTRCTVCSKYHKGGAKAHVQSCRVCGGDEQNMKHVEDVNQQHLCGDKALHLKIVDGFGQANLVAKAIPAPVTPKKKPGKAQTGWIDGGVGE